MPVPRRPPRAASRVIRSPQRSTTAVVASVESVWPRGLLGCTHRWLRGPGKDCPEDGRSVVSDQLRAMKTDRSAFRGRWQRLFTGKEDGGRCRVSGQSAGIAPVRCSLAGVAVREYIPGPSASRVPPAPFMGRWGTRIMSPGARIGFYLSFYITSIIGHHRR